MSIPFWAKPRFVLFAILLYLGAHFAIRMAMGHGLSGDDADQALFSQFYAWAYRYKAPPLFVWMLATLSTVLPIGVLPITILRYTLLGIVFGGSYFTARRLIADPRLAALSVYSFAAINAFAEASHRNLTHSTTLAALLAIAWYLFVRLAAEPRLGWYLALGAAFGLGLLAKWNFAVFMVAVPVACLFNRENRSLVLNWRVIPAALLTATIVLPTVVATLRMGPPSGEDIRTVLQAGSGPGLAQIVEGTLKLLDTAITYSLPLLPIALAVFGLPLWRALRSPRGEAKAGAGPVSATLVGTTIAVGLALLWMFVLFLGATEFRLRYMYPVLLILPVWLFMLVEGGRPSNLAINLFALVMLVLAIGVTVKRAAIQFSGWRECNLCLEQRPYPQLAEELRAAGYQGSGTIVVSGDIAGNLRVVFPDARIVDPDFRSAPKPTGAGQCLAIWPENANDAGVPMPSQFGAHIEGPLRGRADAAHLEGSVSAPTLRPVLGTFRLGYRLYDGPNGDCR